MGTNSTFTRRPGQGWLGRDFVRFDVRTKAEQRELAKAAEEKRNPKVPRVSGWHGYVTLPGNEDLRLKALVIQRDQKIQFEVTTFGEEGKPDTWRKLGEFEVPAFANGLDMTEGTLTHGTRKYIVRFIRRRDRGDMLVRLPQVRYDENDPAMQ